MNLEEIKELYETNFILINERLKIFIINSCGESAFSLYASLLSNTIHHSKVPALKYLEAEIGFSRRKVCNVLDNLKKNGILIVKTGTNNCSNKYWFPCEPFFDLTDYEAIKTYKDFREKTFGVEETEEETKNKIIEMRNNFKYNEESLNKVFEIYRVKGTNNEK